MRYTFDAAKQAANVAKHGVFFAAAQEFEWETALVAVDSRHTYGETSVRIISLRRANSREVRRYASHI